MADEDLREQNAALKKENLRLRAVIRQLQAQVLGVQAEQSRRLRYEMDYLPSHDPDDDPS